MDSKFDIIVIGGGSAGVSAAIASAAKGKRTLVVEKNSQLGGLATNAEVGTICGLYKNDISESFDFNVGKFAQSFAEEIQKRSDATPIKEASGLKFLPFEPKVFREYCEELLNDDGITYLSSAELIEVEIVHNRITGLRISVNDKVHFYSAEAIVDASGKSVVSVLLGHKLINTQLKQAASQVFTLSGLKYDDEANLSLILLFGLRKGVISGVLEENEDRIYIVPGSLKNGKVSLKITIPIAVSLNNDNVEELRASAIKMINKLVLYLKSNVSGFAEIALDSTASEVGVRIDDRPVGMETLTEGNVANGTKVDSGIARGNWPMEIWSDAKRVEMRPVAPNDYYEIPAECLISPIISNLFFAGRSISASDEAIASARVIGTCLQTGYAAGSLAAGYLNNENINQTIRAIQHEQFGE